MRAALETIQQIEQYLLNEMSAGEKLAFENEVNSNPTLKNQVETQRQVVQGIQRMGLKASAIAAKAKYQLRKWTIRIGILLLLISLSSFTYIYLNPDCVPCDKEQPVENTDSIFEVSCCPKTEAITPIEFGPATIEETEIVPIQTESEVPEDIIKNDTIYLPETILEGPDVLINENTDKNSVIDHSIQSYAIDNNSSNTVISEITNALQLENKLEPSFPGGQDELLRWLSNNAIYPQKAIEKGISGTVYIDFVVLKTGKITNVTVQKSVHPILDAATITTIKKMPNWNPALIKGKYVDVKYTLPIRYFAEGGQN
jgi:TonB family protein